MYDFTEEMQSIMERTKKDLQKALETAYCEGYAQGLIDAVNEKAPRFELAEKSPNASEFGSQEKPLIYRSTVVKGE